MRWLIRCAPLMIVALLLPSLARAGDILFASHKASYRMELLSTKPSAGMVAVNGSMDYTFSETCDGWSVETVTKLKIQQNEGDPVPTLWDFVSWEAKDGHTFRFKVRNLRGGEITDSYTGEAHTQGSRGSAVFHTGDGDKLVQLPAGTLFPTAHTRELLTRAQNGERFWANPVFDGSSIDGAFQVSAGMAAVVPEGVQVPKLPASSTGIGLLAKPSWPMSLAFFGAGQPADLPDFEVKLRYFQNGVVTDIVQDFGAFSLKGTLTSLQSGPKPKC